MPTKVSAATLPQPFKVQVTSGNNSIIIDEPEEYGGKGEGLDPYEVLLAALGSCTASTMRMYAQRKKIDLQEVKIDLQLERDDENQVTNITCHVDIVGYFTDEQRVKLMQIAEKCPVHKLLTTPVNIKTTFENTAA